MNPRCELFARKQAAKPGEAPVRNFLVIVPEENGNTFDVTPLARHLNKDGFAYVARPSQNEMQDDSYGVRYLPLRQSLPAFGCMTAVIVVGDEAWAGRAETEYPGASIFLIGAGQAACPGASAAGPCPHRGALCLCDA